MAADNGLTQNKHVSKNNTPEARNLPKTIIPDSQISYHEKPVQEIKPDKKKRRNKSDLGDSFVAPDGGWGWLVSIFCGVSILVTTALAQQFGIIFRDHMAMLGITSSELTTIINIELAVAAMTGLLNGPIFRRLSYRQVALIGSCLVFTGIFACIFANSFLFYCLSFSCCYAFGRGLNISASNLAVYTFFKEKRRTATAYKYGVAGVGPIVLPYVATFLLDYYGVEGTVLFYAGLALNTIPCALMYQPVKWHVKKQPVDAEALKNVSPMDHGDIANPVEPETSVLPRANHGRYGSITSLKTPNVENSLGTWEKQQQGDGEQFMELRGLNTKDNKNDNIINNNSINDKVRSSSVSYSIKEEEEHEDQDYDDNDKNHNDPQKFKEKEREQSLVAEEEQRPKNLPWYKKVAIFFDLDLLCDFSYVNLIIGLTVIHFVENNVSILTPFILSDFGFQKNQIATAMSVLGLFDLIIRFLIPLITAKINLSNRALLAVGIVGMCTGRTFLPFTTNLYVLIGIYIWLGLNKALLTVLYDLIIPGYVPLKRLPAASGLQLLVSGIFSLSFGPFVGIIRDRTSFAFTLNFLDSLNILAISGWGLEYMVRKYRNKPNQGLK